MINSAENFLLVPVDKYSCRVKGPNFPELKIIRLHMEQIKISSVFKWCELFCGRTFIQCHISAPLELPEPSVPAFHLQQRFSGRFFFLLFLTVIPGQRSVSVSVWFSVVSLVSLLMCLIVSHSAPVHSSSAWGLHSCPPPLSLLFMTSAFDFGTKAWDGSEVGVITEQTPVVFTAQTLWQCGLCVSLCPCCFVSWCRGETLS